MDNFELATKELLELIPKQELDEVLKQPICDIEPCFLGFVDTYKALSDLIPKHFTVIDLGCGFNPQSFFFKDHLKYIAVDSFQNTKRFMTDNCTFYEMDISDFIEKHISDFYLDETFAIMNYVPLWGRNNHNELVRKHFKNLFVYYPHGYGKSIGME